MVIMLTLLYTKYADSEPKESTPLMDYSEILDKFTKFSGFRELSSSLHYEGVVSSIKFDRDWELLALAGLAKEKSGL